MANISLHRISLPLAVLLVCAGCTTNKVYLFARYLETSQVEQLEEKLHDNGFEVISNQHYFPFNIKKNTLVHSYTNDPKQIENIIRVVNQLEFSPVESSAYKVAGKDLFTRDGFGLYLLPSVKQIAQNSSAKSTLFNLKQVTDLVGYYYAIAGCDEQASLQLNPDMSFIHYVDLWDERDNDESTIIKEGTWNISGSQIVLHFEGLQRLSYKFSKQQEYDGAYIHYSATLSPLAKSIEEKACGFNKELLELAESI